MLSVREKILNVIVLSPVGNTVKIISSRQVEEYDLYMHLILINRKIICLRFGCIVPACWSLC